MNAIPLSRAHRGALFLLALFPASLGAYVPGFAAAPALVFVVRLVAQTLRGLAWDDATDQVPAVLAALAEPFSIATGIVLCFIAQAVLKTVAGRLGQVGGAVWLVASLRVAKCALG